MCPLGHYRLHLNRQEACFDSSWTATVLCWLSLLLIVTVTLHSLAAKSRWQPSQRRGQLMMTTDDPCLLTSFCSCSSIQTSASWHFFLETRPVRKLVQLKLLSLMLWMEILATYILKHSADSDTLFHFFSLFYLYLQVFPFTLIISIPSKMFSFKISFCLL